MPNLKPFVLLQAAQFTSFVAGSATFIATPLLALEVANSSTVAALVIAVTSIPALVLTPFVGGLVDRFGRRRMAIVLELITFFTTAAIPLASSTFGMTIPTLMLLSTLKAVFQPGGVTARKSLLPDAAAAGKLTLDRANSIGEAVSAAGFATGPALAAILMSISGLEAAFWCAALFSALSGLLAWTIRVREKQEEVETDPEGHHPIKFAVQGFVALSRIPALLIVFLSFTVLAIVYMPTEMVVLPRYYDGINFKEGIGWLITTMSVFTVMGSLMFERLALWLGYANLVRIAGVTIGLMMIPMSFFPPYWAMLIFGAVLGFVWGPMMPLLNTLIQTMVPANLRGRVFSVETVMWNTAPLTSFIVTGIAIDAFGVQPVYMVIAWLVLIASLLVAVAPQLRDLRKLHAQRKAEA